MEQDPRAITFDVLYEHCAEQLSATDVLVIEFIRTHEIALCNATDITDHFRFTTSTSTKTLRKLSQLCLIYCAGNRGRKQYFRILGAENTFGELMETIVNDNIDTVLGKAIELFSKRSYTPQTLNQIATYINGRTTIGVETIKLILIEMIKRKYLTQASDGLDDTTETKLSYILNVSHEI
jgi:hypothetical protein